nr:putative ribonuclease H-like domain-containing protein [Tanacetum cinerariifolium]
MHKEAEERVSTKRFKNLLLSGGINAASSSFSHPYALEDYSKLTKLEDTSIFDDAYDDRHEGTAADYNNLEIGISVSPILSARIHKDRPKEQIIREVHFAIQRIGMTKQNKAGLLAFINKLRRTNHKDFQNCLFACFLSQMEPEKLLNVWTLVDLPHGKRAIGTKWVFRNKKDQREIVVRNKARLVAQGHKQEEGIDYDEVFAHVARIEVIRLFLAYASFMDFIVYQMDVKSAFLYGTIEEEVYVNQPLGFVDLEFPNRVYKQSTPMETHKPLSKDANGTDVDVHLYRYLKGQPKLGLWYPKDSPFDLEANSDSDYAGASLDRKSTTGDLKFVDQYNMVTYLEKSDDNTEFHQIVEFLSSCSLNYALTVSPTIYASYIEKFWNTVSSKTINYVKQIHATVDGRAVVISESLVRSDLLFDDEDGVICLINDEIFENLVLMGYEQLSTKLTFQKAICLAKGQKFNFSKLIFDGMLRNSDSKKFLMYLRFLQLFLNNQLKDLPERFNDTYETLCHTKRVFSNMTFLKEWIQVAVPGAKKTWEVLDLEKEKDAQAVEILNLNKRVKKLERKRKSSIYHSRKRKYKQVESSNDDLDEEDASKQGRISDKTKLLFQDNDFDGLHDAMQDVERGIVNAVITGVSTVSAPVTTAGVTINTIEPRTPPT